MRFRHARLMAGALALICAALPAWADAGSGSQAAWPLVAPCGEASPGMVCVPGGPFLRGSDRGPANERPEATVWVQTFYLDATEVTTA